eukprot:GFKZ01010909.1.p1 GENE.GFKZ01010909.1~~GFKZ01010909.1.p1  ORF type:complete len:365 (-),score=54.66 GFKZ01010909.1:968-2062(-)
MQPPRSIQTLPRPSSPTPQLLSDLPSRITAAQTLFSTYRAESPLSILQTPLIPSPLLSTPDTSVYMKLESEQLTNSFKLRGALNCISSIPSSIPIITASTGNHGLAVAHSLRITHHSGSIFLPTTAKRKKVNALEALRSGVQNFNLRFVSGDCLDAELAAKKYADEIQGLYVSPYNDERVIAGQGTVGVEIAETIDRIHGEGSGGVKSCYVTVGGGGLISGVGAYLKSKSKESWRIVGCLPEVSAAMYERLKGEEGRVECGETLSDGSAGDIEVDAMTVGICGRVVDAWVMVSEKEIERGIRDVFECHGKAIEGAAAVAVAGCRADDKWRRENGCKVAVVVICGGNIDGEVFGGILGKRGNERD